MPDISNSERGLVSRGGTRDAPPVSSRSAPARSGTTQGNPGQLVGTESKDGVTYARYRARPGTWVSASMAELGYDRLHGRDTAYGAYTGIVLGGDGKPLPSPDRIEPGQEYLIPIGTVNPVADSSRRPKASSSTRPSSSVQHRRNRAPFHYQPLADLNGRPELQRSVSPDNKALDSPLVSGRMTTDVADGGDQHLFTSANATPLCYTPFPLTGEEYASVLGVVANAFIQQDYVETKKLRRDRNVHIDDSFNYRRFNNFLINKNLRRLTPAQKAAIKAYRGKRPDIVLDTGLERGFEEIKPDHPAGIKEGEKQVRQIADFMSATSLPYPFGTAYVPKAEIPVGMFFVLTEPVDVYLACQRKSGLIVYHYCFRADWKRLKGKIKLVFQLLIYFIWLVLYWLLNEKNPQPGPVPPPQLPAPDPIRQPVIPPPDRVPAAARLSGFVPSTTLKALKAISVADLERLAQHEVEIAFEPYAER